MKKSARWEAAHPKATLTETRRPHSPNFVSSVGVHPNREVISKVSNELHGPTLTKRWRQKMGRSQGEPPLIKQNGLGFHGTLNVGQQLKVVCECRAPTERPGQIIPCTERDDSNGR